MEEHLQEVLMLALTTAFALWAAVVKKGVDGVIDELKQLREHQELFDDRMNSYILATERRLSRLENHLEFTRILPGGFAERHTKDEPEV